MINDYAPPPRGWVYGFLLGIFSFWFSGVIWAAWRNHDIGPVRLIGDVMILISTVLIAYEALTNTDYSTAKATLIARRVILPLGLAMAIIGSQL